MTSTQLLRRLIVTHTASHVFDQNEIDQVWVRLRAFIPDHLLRGDESWNGESRAMTLYEAFGESLIELFHPRQDDDQGYEVEDYDSEA